MANTITTVQNKILARGLLTLRKKVLLPTLVNGDYSMDARKKGDVVNVPIAAAAAATDVSPAAVPPTPASKAPSSVAIPLDKWKHSDFHLTDKEMAEINAREHWMPMQAHAAMVAIAEQINSDIFAAAYPGVYGYIGTAGTTPFGSAVDVAADVFKTLNIQLCPKSQRRIVLDFAAEGNAVKLAAFRDASQAGKDSVIIEGELGRFFGMDWYSDNQVPTHTAGTASGATTDAAGYAVGVKTVTLASAGTGSILVGDIILFTGDTQTYVVTSGDASVAGGGTISFEPGLKVAIATSATPITLKATHVVNLAFHREAIAFAMRPLDDSNEGNDDVSVMQDPETGIVLRMERIREYKQWAWDIDVLYGAKLVRPELACRLAG